MENNTRGKKSKPTGIAYRMLVLMIIFVFVIFTAIFASFSYFMNEYISGEMTKQLEIAVQDIEVRYYSEIMGRLPTYISYGEPELIDGMIIQKNTIKINYQQLFIMIMNYTRESNAKSEVNVIIYNNKNYRRIYPDDIYLNRADMDNLMRMVKAYNLTETKKIYQTTNANGSYYFSNINLGELFGEGLNGLFVTFYISTEKYDNFISSIYSMLIIILISATVFTLVYVAFISRSISKPIQKLCGFADEIGRGNFKRNEYAFTDRELIDLNMRMNETARKLEINDEDQKTFFQNVSHELKTPLMSIKGYAEGIKYGIFSGEKEKEDASDIIIAESDRLNDLVADLLYISKIDSSKQAKTENFVSADLGDIIEDCADKLRGILINSQNTNNNNNNNNNNSKEKKISINHPKHNIYIKCDEESLIRAVMNITANCIRYAKTTVNIDYYENYEGGRKVIMSIKDDGPGIDEQDLPNIFKRFYKGKGGKHGIGLSIAKSIIEQHGAKISASNRTDCSGAEFIIEFDREN